MTGTHAQHALAEAYAGAARAIALVLGGGALSRALPTVLPPHAPASLRGAIIDFSYSTLRAFGLPQFLTGKLLNRTVDDPVLIALLYVALLDLRAHPQRAHTIVDQAVRAADQLGRTPAKGFVNAVLRNYQRRSESLEAAVRLDPTCVHQHPLWWIERLRSNYPGHWQAVLAAGNAPPPLTLRVNRRRGSVESALRMLADAGIDARVITPAAARAGQSMAIGLAQGLAVERIPGFATGHLSVQDAGAQWAAALLDLAPGQRVLDACAAPGGKAGHILETADVDLTALDNDRERATRIAENLERLGLHARIVIGDAATPEVWWDGECYDRILADVPCTASGVVRRNPDIKWLRRRGDVAKFARVQTALLAALWRVLRPGGRLVLVTCSVFHEENQAQAEAFASRFPDAKRIPVTTELAALGQGAPPYHGQLLPSADNDGFFYAIFIKQDRPPE